MLPSLISLPVAAQGTLKQRQVISLNAAAENRDRDLALTTALTTAQCLSITLEVRRRKRRILRWDVGKDCIKGHTNQWESFH